MSLMCDPAKSPISGPVAKPSPFSAAFQDLQTGLERAHHCVELSGSTAVAALLQVKKPKWFDGKGPSTRALPAVKQRALL
jgi:hypothetical protein